MFKYAINSCMHTSIGAWVPAYPIEEVLRRLAAIGYDGVEIPCSAPDTWPYYLNDAKIKQIDAWQKKYGIKIMSLMPCPGGSPGGNASSMNDAERDWTIRYAKDVIDLAVAWDVKRIAYVPGWTMFGTRRKDAWPRCVDSLRQIAAYAQKKDDEIIICVENTAADSNIIDTIDDSLELIEEVGLPNLGVMFDVAHSLFRAEDPSDWVYAAGKYLHNIHLTDTDRRAPGLGSVDFYQILKALDEIGYEDYVNLEIGFGRNVCPDSEARIALEHLKSVESKLNKA
jgi:protein FrlC